MSYFAIVSLSFRVSKFPVSRNLETSENQRKPGFNFDILLMRGCVNVVLLDGKVLAFLLRSSSDAPCSSVQSCKDRNATSSPL